MKQLLCICLAFSFAASLRADTIIFKNGEELDGTIVEKDENSIKLEVLYGTVIVPMARVRRIEADTAAKIADREKKKQEALEFEKEMKADGKIQYKGKWVTEAEKQADMDKVAEAKQKKKDEADAAKKKQEDAVAAKLKAQADAAVKAALNNNNNNNRTDNFSQRHNRSGLNNDPFNSNGNNSSSYGGSSNNGNVINNGSVRRY